MNFIEFKDLRAALERRYRIREESLNGQRQLAFDKNGAWRILAPEAADVGMDCYSGLAIIGPGTDTQAMSSLSRQSLDTPFISPGDGSRYYCCRAADLFRNGRDNINLLRNIDRRMSRGGQ